MAISLETEPSQHLQSCAESTLLRPEQHRETSSMRKQISLLFGLSLLANVCIAGDWTEKYTPTKAEWLQQALERDIETTTDRWRNRV